MEHEETCIQTELQIEEHDTEYICNLFKMLGDPKRLQVVCALMGTRMCVAHLAERVGMEQSALSHQLRNLKNAGIIKSKKQGKQVYYSLDDAHITGIIQQAVDHSKHVRGGD